MRAISIDLRERIVRAVKEEKQTRKEVAGRYQVSVSSVGMYIRLDRKGELKAKKHPGPKAWLNKKNCEILRKQVEKYPDWTLEEHSQELYKDIGIELKKSAIHKYLDKMNISLKKRAIEQQNKI